KIFDGLGVPTYPLPELESALEAGRTLKLELAPRLYPKRRLFLYKNSYTDWHYHNADETLTSQLFGSKEMLLVPPTEDVWNVMHAFTAGGGIVGNAQSRTKSLSCLRPYYTKLEEGDLVYIPVYWW